MISRRTIGRLSLYRRLLNEMQAEGSLSVYSHDLAAKAGVTAAQVRRDVMYVGYTGSPTRGYSVSGLAEAIGTFLDAPEPQSVALVGVGNLGRAILAFFSGRRPKLSVVATFDSDPNKIGRVIHGCRCYAVDEMETRLPEMGVGVAILTVPAGAAQGVAEMLVRAGVRGILNFAPVPLRLPQTVFVEDIDMTVSLEKVAYFARQGAARKELGR